MDGSIIFGKNSDRPMGEGQNTRTYLAAKHAPDEALACTYIEIPQAPRTHRIALSQIDWMWGGEMGANEHGVVIGNEAVWTKLPAGPPALLGMDLVRLGLERGSTAREALDIMTSLLEQFGQGGACAENDPGFTYDNSFLIADPIEAWVLETAGRFWVAERVTEGTRNISNRLSIRSDFDLCSAGLEERSKSLLGMDLVRLGLERGSTAREALDIMTSLLEQFGQGGACAENDPGFTYDNSFLIADPIEAWVLETAGRFWVAERVTEGTRNISNRLSIRSDFDLCSAGLEEYARAQGGLGGNGRPDFAALFSTEALDPEPGSREFWGTQLMAESDGRMSVETMKDILRHHDSGICMHGMFETTASMVSRLAKDGDCLHWFADGANPCKAGFTPIDLVADTSRPIAVV